jgi:hypothetical protein
MEEKTGKRDPFVIGESGRSRFPTSEGDAVDHGVHGEVIPNL